MILGLPGETKEMILSQADTISQLPITTLKLHQLQLIKGTRMAKEYFENNSDFHLFDVDEYIELVIEFIQRLRPDIVLERFISQSPKDLLLAPDWNLKNYEFTQKVTNRIAEVQAWQGKKYQKY